MNIPFPKITPCLIDARWFNPDKPYDEDAELTAMEQANKRWLNSVGKKYMKRAPFGKANPEPMEEEVETDEEEGEPHVIPSNDESDESEETHDEDDDDVMRTTYTAPPPRTINPEPQVIEDDDTPELIHPAAMDPTNTTLWPIQN